MPGQGLFEILLMTIPIRPTEFVTGDAEHDASIECVESAKKARFAEVSVDVATRRWPATVPLAYEKHL